MKISKKWRSEARTPAIVDRIAALAALTLPDWVVFRFLGVGMAATGTYLCSATILNVFTRLAPVTVTAIALAISVILSYIGHHRFTFRLAGNHAACFTRFLVVSAILYGTSSGLVYVSVEQLRIPVIYTVIMVTVLYPVGSFFLHSLWTFVSGPQDGQA